MGEILEAAARRMSASALARGFSSQALHMYTDEAGQVQHARAPGSSPTSNAS